MCPRQCVRRVAQWLLPGPLRCAHLGRDGHGDVSICEAALRVIRGPRRRVRVRGRGRARVRARVRVRVGVRVRFWPEDGLVYAIGFHYAGPG